MNERTKELMKLTAVNELWPSGQCVDQIAMNFFRLFLARKTQFLTFCQHKHCFFYVIRTCFPQIYRKCRTFDRNSSFEINIPQLRLGET